MLISTADLALHVDDPAWVVFDCRHDLGDPLKGGRLYREGHVPGARFAPVDTALSGPKTGSNGRHPLPEPAAFAEFLGRMGVSAAVQIVAYDDVGGQYAARLWWMARWIGLTHVSLLDGGFPKWIAEGRPVSTDVPSASPQTLSLRLQENVTWNAAEVQARLNSRDALLIDARAAERYRGDVEPIDRVAGHIPGAVNRFFKANLKPDLTFRPPEELRRDFATLLGARAPTAVAHQCGSGITACANLFAMEYAGLSGSKLYPGSWSEWIADPARPIAKG